MLCFNCFEAEYELCSIVKKYKKGLMGINLVVDCLKCVTCGKIDDTKQYEVIGNIFENKELLKK